MLREGGLLLVVTMLAMAIAKHGGEQGYCDGDGGDLVMVKKKNIAKAMVVTKAAVAVVRPPLASSGMRR